MQSILAKLNKCPGVLGSLVVNKDGIVVASELRVELDEKGIGAVSSSILAALDGAVRHVQIGKMKRFVIGGSENKIAIVDTGPALLLILMDREANMGMVNVGVKVAESEVVAKAKM